MIFYVLYKLQQIYLYRLALKFRNLRISVKLKIKNKFKANTLFIIKNFNTFFSKPFASSILKSIKTKNKSKLNHEVHIYTYNFFGACLSDINRRFFCPTARPPPALTPKWKPKWDGAGHRGPYWRRIMDNTIFKREF